MGSLISMHVVYNMYKDYGLPIELQVRPSNYIDEKDKKDSDIAAIPDSVLIESCLDLSSNREVTSVRIGLHYG